MNSNNLLEQAALKCVLDSRIKAVQQNPKIFDNYKQEVTVKAIIAHDDVMYVEIPGCTVSMVYGHFKSVYYRGFNLNCIHVSLPPSALPAFTINNPVYAQRKITGYIEKVEDWGVWVSFYGLGGVGVYRFKDDYDKKKIAKLKTCLFDAIKVSPMDVFIWEAYPDY